MGFTGNGINDLINKLDKIAEAAEELDGEHSVPLSELFNQDFFLKMLNC